MKRVLKWWPVLLLTLAAAGVGAWLQWGPSSADEATNQSSVFAVERGALVSSISITGEVSAPLQEELSFDVNKARLIELLVAPGQEVKAGDTIARIDPTDLENAVEQAAADLTLARDGLEQVQAPSSELDLIQAKLSVEQAKASHEDTQAKLGAAQAPATEVDLAQARLAVEQAKASLGDAREKLEEAQSPATEVDLAQARLAVEQAKADREEAIANLADLEAPAAKLELANANLAVVQAETDLEDAREALQALLAPDKEAAQVTVWEAAEALESAKNQLIVAQNSPDDAAKLRTLEYEAKWYRNNYWAAQVKFERLEIDQQKLNWEYSNMLAAEERLKVAQAKAGDDIAGAKDRVADAEGALEDAREYLANLEGGPPSLELALAEGTVTQAEDNLVKAEAALANLEAGPSPVELALAEGTVAQAEDNLVRAEASLAKLEAGPSPIELAQAMLDVSLAESKFTDAQKSLAELEAGPGSGEVAKIQLEVAQAEYSLARAQEKLAELEAGPDQKDVEVAEAKVIAAETELETAQAALDAATMVAPFDGTIMSVGAEVDQLVSSSTLVATLVDLSNLRVQAIVDESDIAKVNIGQLVDITFDAFPEYSFWGEVLEVPLQGRLSQNILTYEVPISLEGRQDAALRPGMTANLSIIVGRRDDALLVPAMAVQQGEDGYVVMVQDVSNGATTWVPVQVGLSDGTNAEITQGLSEGDRVVVTYELPQQQQQFGGPNNAFGNAQRLIGR